jgi:hypothetical protein
MSLILLCDCPGRFIKHEKDGSFCSKCGSKAIIDIGIKASSLRQLDVDYDCPITGKPIRSKRAHEENLKLHGKHVYEEGEKEDAARNRRLANEEFENKLCETAAQYVAQLPPEAKAKLEQELLASEIQTTRR